MINEAEMLILLFKVYLKLEFIAKCIIIDLLILY